MRMGPDGDAAAVPIRTTETRPPRRHFFFGPVPLLPTAGSQQPPGLQPRQPRAGETPDEACRGPRPLRRAEPQGLGRGG